MQALPRVAEPTDCKQAFQAVPKTVEGVEEVFWMAPSRLRRTKNQQVRCVSVVLKRDLPHFFNILGGLQAQACQAC